MSARRASLAAALLSLAAAGCRSIGPTYQAPDLTSVVSSPWRSVAIDIPEVRLSAEVEPVAEWWTQFGDDALVRLMSELARANPTLAEARQRVAAAQAVCRQTTSARRPRLDATADVGSASTGRDAINFRGPPPGRQTEFYSAGLASSWELDLWGRIERLERAAAADAEVTVEDYHAAAVSLAAELAVAYIDLRTLQARIELAGDGIVLQEKTLTLAESALAVGTGTRVAVAQAQRQLSQARALLPPLRDAANRSENRIALLLGRRPSADLVGPGELPQLPPVIGLGLPAALLNQRADLRRAVAAYRAAVERIGAAEAERYPSLELAGTLNVQSADAARLLEGHAFTYNLGPSLRVPLFQGGRIDATVRERTARAEERRVAVERTLLAAIGEVEDAAVGVVQNEERCRELSDAAAAACHAVGLTEQLRDVGLADESQRIAAQRVLVDAQDRSLVASRDALTETVRLYRALGGGWQTLAPSSTAPAADNHATGVNP